MNDLKINNHWALQPIEGLGLPTDFWPYFHLSADRGERSSSEFRRDMWSDVEFPSRCCKETLSTTSLKCCLLSTDAIGKREKFTHAYQCSRSPHVSVLQSNRPGFWKKKRSDTFFLTSWYINLFCLNWLLQLVIRVGLVITNCAAPFKFVLHLFHPPLSHAFNSPN